MHLIIKSQFTISLSYILVVYISFLEKSSLNFGTRFNILWLRKMSSIMIVKYITDISWWAFHDIGQFQTYIIWWRRQEQKIVE